MTALLSPCTIADRFDLANYGPGDRDLLDRLRRVQIAGARHGQAGYYSDGDFRSDADWCYGIGAEIVALEETLEDDCGMVFDLYTDAHTAFYRDGTINPNDRPGQHGRERCYDFQFGTCATTHVYVWARSVEDGLEIAAEWLAEHAPGHIMLEGDERLADLWREACEEAGLVYPPPGGSEELLEDGYYAAFESAEADLTYTESGYLTSYEWFVDELDGPPGPQSR